MRTFFLGITAGLIAIVSLNLSSNRMLPHLSLKAAKAADIGDANKILISCDNDAEENTLYQILMDVTPEQVFMGMTLLEITTQPSPHVTNTRVFPAQDLKDAKKYPNGFPLYVKDGHEIIFLRVDPDFDGVHGGIAHLFYYRNLLPFPMRKTGVLDMEVHPNGHGWLALTDRKHGARPFSLLHILKDSFGVKSMNPASN